MAGTYRWPLVTDTLRVRTGALLCDNAATSHPTNSCRVLRDMFFPAASGVTISGTAAISTALQALAAAGQLVFQGSSSLSTAAQTIVVIAEESMSGIGSLTTAAQAIIAVGSHTIMMVGTAALATAVQTLLAVGDAEEITPPTVEPWAPRMPSIAKRRALYIRGRRRV